ncbi:MAG: hypothetical protein ABI599_11910 [Flavobacteriales bacterium]
MLRDWITPPPLEVNRSSLWRRPSSANEADLHLLRLLDELHLDEPTPHMLH